MAKKLIYNEKNAKIRMEAAEIMEKIAESVPKLSPGTHKRLQKAAEFTKVTSSLEDVIPAKAGIS